MTIRLRCAACRRKLKVVDAALGKKVQCPVCGARFIGRIESSPPPVNETPPAAQPKTEPQAITPDPATVEAASNSMPPLDALFAEMTTSPLTLEECGIPREVSLQEPPAEIEIGGNKPLEPEAVEEEMPVIEEAIDEEIAEEVEQEAGEKQQPKRKKKRGLSVSRLAGLGLLMVLGSSGLGFLVYRFYSGSIIDALLFGCLAGIGLVMLLDVALRLPRRNRPT